MDAEPGGSIPPERGVEADHLSRTGASIGHCFLPRFDKGRGGMRHEAFH